jgi:uncharacterized pyridoxamine 5'-phosphate oxidase family protein
MNRDIQQGENNKAKYRMVKDIPEMEICAYVDPDYQGYTEKQNAG